MNEEEIEKIVDLFDKGYCNECNELNCLGGMPSSRKVADAIKNLQSQLTKSNNKIEKIKQHLLNHNEEIHDEECTKGKLVFNLDYIKKIIDGSDE